MTGKVSLVIDANIFIEGLSPLALGDRYVLLITPEIEYEIRSKGDENALDLALSAGLRVSSPGNRSMENVDLAATETGDISRLSFADKTLIALALEEEGEIMSDDYSVQNIAKLLGIPIITGLQRGIKKILKWKQRCTGCRKDIEKNSKMKDCPVCGSPLKVVVDKD